MSGKNKSSLGDYIHELVHSEMKGALGTELEGELEMEVEGVTDELIAVAARAVALLAAAKVHQESVIGSSDDVLAMARTFTGFVLGQIEEGK